MTLGERLIKLRNEKNFSQLDLSNMIGIDCHTIQQWESDREALDVNNAIKLSEIYSISLDYLLKDDLDSVNRTNSNNEKYSYGEVLYEKKMAILEIRMLLGKFKMGEFLASDKMAAHKKANFVIDQIKLSIYSEDISRCVSQYKAFLSTFKTIDGLYSIEFTNDDSQIQNNELINIYNTINEIKVMGRTFDQMDYLASDRMAVQKAVNRTIDKIRLSTSQAEAAKYFNDFKEYLSKFETISEMRKKQKLR